MQCLHGSAVRRVPVSEYSATRDSHAREGRAVKCIADLLAILTNIPEDWRRCPCEICQTVRPLVDFKAAAANDIEKEEFSEHGRIGLDSPSNL